MCKVRSDLWRDFRLNRQRVVKYLADCIVAVQGALRYVADCNVTEKGAVKYVAHFILTGQ